MLHAKFCGNQTIGSREEESLRVFTIYRCGGHLGHLTQMSNKLLFPYPRSPHIKFGFDWPSNFEEEDV